MPCPLHTERHETLVTIGGVVWFGSFQDFSNQLQIGSPTTKNIVIFALKPHHTHTQDEVCSGKAYFPLHYLVSDKRLRTRHFCIHECIFKGLI